MAELLQTPKPARTDLPPGFTVRLSDPVKVCDDARTLVGEGAVLHLAEPAAALLRESPVITSAPGVPGVLAVRLLDRDFAHPSWSEPAPHDDAVTDATVVVPVRDRPAGLDRLLSTLPPGCPVVVVDDASIDGAAVAEVAARRGARLIRLDDNRGPAAARNRGLRAVATPYVAFLDSDVVPEPGWLGRLRRHLDDPACAVVAPRVLGLGEARGWLERYEQARSSLDLGAEPAAVRVRGRVAYLPAACLLARVEALGDGFDEAMRCGEDVDLVWRLLGAGWRVRYDPAATVRHDHRTAPAEWLRRKAFYGTSAAPLAARHRDTVAPMVLSPWSTVFVGALLAQRRWSLPVSAVAAGAATVTTARRLGRAERPVRTAAVLVLEGAVASLWQTASAALRHHWPLAVVAAGVSPRARRALAAAAVAEGLLDWRRHHPDLDPVRYVVAHRLDDLAYGTGLWWGAVRARSPRPLLPALRGFRPGRTSPMETDTAQPTRTGIT